MLFLMIDVIAKGLRVRWTNTEQTISVLPMEGGQIVSKRFHKLGRVFLEQLHDFGGCCFLGEIAKDVNVVVNPADRYRVALEVLKNSRLAGPDALANVRGEPRGSRFGGKDNVGTQDVQ